MIYYSVKELLSLLNKKQAIYTLFMVLLMIFVALFETLSVAIVIPSILLLLDPNQLNEFFFKFETFHFLFSLSKQELILYGLLFLLLLFTAKTFFMIFYSWYESKFVYSLFRSFSQEVFEGYLDQPYIESIQKNTSNIIKNMTTEINAFINAFQSITSFTSDALIILCVSSLLFFVSPSSAVMSVLLLIISIYIYYILTRKKLFKYGKIRTLYEGLRLQAIQETLGSKKEILVLGRRQGFVKKYLESNILTTTAIQKQFLINSIPKHLIELIAIITLCLIIFVLIFNRFEITNIISILGLYAAATFRILPSMNRLISNLQRYRFVMPTLNIMQTEIKSIRKNRKKIKLNSISIENIEFKNNLKFENINFSYPNSTSRVINNLTFEIKHGSVIGIMGKSGSGKTTFVDIFLGLLPIDDGKIFMDDICINNSLESLQNKIGFVSQNFFLTDDSIKNNITYGFNENSIDEDALKNAIKYSNLDSLINSSSNGIDTKVGERGMNLSGGQKQRICIARALYHNPSILIFDEATSSLDENNEKSIMESIYHLGKIKTILIISHKREILSGCDSIYIFKNGNLFRDSMYEKK
tara:strand:+ start:1148 stop:2902 length:1755 start_codon:yes stop_codon:yes gene_type:complete